MQIKIELMSKEKIKKALAIKDLTDPANGIHAVNLVVKRIVKCLSNVPGWPIPEIRRSSPITSVANNFDRLLFPPDNLSRSSIYTRYITKETLLRTHTSAMIPDILEEIKKRGVSDYIVVCPGICYRRDIVDRKHCGEPHQMDIWRIKRGEPKLSHKDLVVLIETIIECLLPGNKYRANKTTHPYTINGLEVEAYNKGEWVEILECGQTHPKILENAGLSSLEYSGLAMGLGLDRLVMLIKRIDDIRILRAEDPRIKKQMSNLDLYRPVSKMPPVQQDLSFSVMEEDTEEDVCEAIREAMGKDIDLLEEITIISETPYEQLPQKAIERLGIKPGQKNILVRITLRSHERSLLKDEANKIRDRVYVKVNKSGTKGYLGIP